MKKLNLKLKNNRNGITLIALVITIIILLILAGVSIATLTGDNGILNMANKAKEQTEIEKYEEQKQLIILGAKTIENKNEIIDYLTKEFKKIDSEANVSDIGNGYYIICNNEKFIYDYNFNAHKVNEGNVNFWDFIENEDNTITIIGYKYEPTDNIVIPNIINDKKVSIIDCSFKGNTNLTSMEISYGIEKITSELFADCINLTGNLNLPDSLTYLQKGTFSRCKGLTGDVNLKNITYIGNHVFSQCTGLDGIIYDNPNGIDVGYMSFYDCNKLKGKISISSFLVNDNALTFTNCKSLEEVTLKEGITKIPSNTFTACQSLINLKIPDGVVSIGYAAFLNCINLSSLYIPNSVMQIEEMAFWGCNSLAGEITLNSNIIIGESAFPTTITIKYV